MLQFLLARFRKAPVQFSLTCLVLACHLFFFAHLLSSPKEPARKTRERRIVVNTAKSKSPAPPLAQKQTRPIPVKQNPPPISQPQAKAVAAAAPKPKPQEKTKTIAKATNKTPAKPAVKSTAKSTDKTAAKSTPKKKQENPAVSAELLQQLQESIAKIEKKPDKYRATQQFVLPDKPAPVIGARPATSLVADHHDLLSGIKEELIQQLHLALHLPDYGEVKVQIELTESGNVRNVKVLKAASQKNREYLEKELPCMSFSHLAVHKLSAKERTFIISFHNEL